MEILVNRKYSWYQTIITFLENGEIVAFERGNYSLLEERIVEAKIGSIDYIFRFNKKYTKFKSTRKYDNEITRGILIETFANAVTLNIKDIAFITLTNNGYMDYTLNCLKSLNKINSEIQLKCYCVGKKGNQLLNSMGYSSEFIKPTNKSLSGFQSFRNNEWADITYQKFNIIYKNLLSHKYVCFTDGDIVYENPKIFNYLLENIGGNDMLIQTEAIKDDISTKELCTGFMFIKSNPKTISLFNPINVEPHKNKCGNNWNDQLYVNAFKHTITYNTLPLTLFPNGRYYYANHQTINPFMIHFNWVVGHTKKQKMIEHSKWYIANSDTLETNNNV
jgi:hypothetical protein